MLELVLATEPPPGVEGGEKKSCISCEWFSLKRADTLTETCHVGNPWREQIDLWDRICQGTYGARAQGLRG